MIRTYASAMAEIKALEQLDAIQAASVPHMNPESHRDTMRHLTSMANIDTKAAPASDADLSAIGIQVEHVPKEVTSDE